MRAEEGCEPVVTAAALTSQMRRDRKRLKDVQAELEVLRGQVLRMQSHPARLALMRARRIRQRLASSIPSLLRGSRTSAEQPAAQKSPPPPAAPRPASRGQVLVIDDHWPQPDRDSGSVDIVNLVQCLRELGFDVRLAAARDHGYPSPARDALDALGIRCLTMADAPSVEAFLRDRGGSLDLCVLCRVYCGGRFLEQLLRDAPQARIVFNSIDLAFLREERRALQAGDEARLAAAGMVREREEAIIRGSDATIVVSRAELDLLAQGIPEALVAELPLARPLAPPTAPFGRRSGIGFIGGFAHAPNVDAVRHFLAAIWPLVLRDLPNLEMTIVGSDFPTGLLEGIPGRVRALGHLPDIGPWFEGLRLTVAPLTFGAGAKGKVASSLAAGVPCIATPVAAEGMSLRDGGGVLIADEPEAFAARLREAYTDEVLWGRLSAEGLGYAAFHLSLDAWRARLDALLRTIGL
ncbi:glycosyltransferase family 4 protein [Pararoseomonas sp. SCSIO 73927]|uniref:glycosyltransferase family 4 protein n=1 Tax=Pararoseomonas sp. SCSIO 73927 TaxID=3114537 RepID=UPI0030CB818C